jgi:predicted PurR-regulated permease PerM
VSDGGQANSEQAGADGGAAELARTLRGLFVWGVVVGLGVYFFQSITRIGLLLLLAGSMAALLRPLSRGLPMRRMLRGTIVGLGFWLAIAALLAVLGYFLSGPIQQQWQNWSNIRSNLNATLTQLSRSLGLETTLTTSRVVDQIANWLLGSQGSVFVQFADIAGIALVGIVLVVFGSIYLLSEDTQRLVEAGARLLPEADRPRLRLTLATLEPRLRGWLVGMAASMGVTGVISGIGFWALGLDFALLLAIFVGLSEIIPTLGPVIAFVAVGMVAVSQGSVSLLGVLVLYAVLQVIESYVIYPLVMHRAVAIPPIVTLFTVVLWGRLLGPLGLVLAIPINLLLWTLTERFLLDRQQEL